MSEISSIWKALDKEEQAGRYLISAFYRIRLLTAQRGREVLRMKWGDLRGTRRFGVDRSERRDEEPRSHRVPLSTAVLEILKAVGARLEEDRRRANSWREKKGEPVRQPSEWVFPSPRGTAPIANTQKAFDRVRARLWKTEFHGARSSADCGDQDDR